MVVTTEKREAVRRSPRKWKWWKGAPLWKDARRRFLRNKAADQPHHPDHHRSGGDRQAPPVPATPSTIRTGAPCRPLLTWRRVTGSVPTALGRDLFVRTLLGGRISLMVGIMGALVAVIIGTLYGAASGFIGSRVDNLMMRVLEILNAFPSCFFVIMLVTFFGRNLALIFLAIGAVSWLDMARIVRGQTLSFSRAREFIEAAHVCGVSKWKIITRHIVPNVLGIVVYATLLVPG